MKIFGLRAYLLFNILVISTFGILLIVIISTKITEQFAIQGRIEGTKSILSAFESTYFKIGKTEEGLSFLESALEKGATGILIAGNKKYIINPTNYDKKKTPNDLNIYKNLGENKISINGSSILPFSTYKSYEIIFPLKSKYKADDGVVYIFQPLISFQETIELSRRLASISAILLIILIGIFGYYLLSRTVINPIEKLIEITKQIAKGFFPSDIKIGNISEINKLYDSMDNMFSEIEEKTESLEKNILELEESNNNLVETQKQLIATEKLASLGILSAGVAHEIGNPIYSISGYVEILKKDKNITDDKKQEYLKKIENEIERISLIIKTLLDYSKPKDINISNEELNEVVKESLEILESQGTLKNIELKVKLSEEPLIVNMDRNQVIQVLINLIINAVDAISDNNGIIEITTKINSEKNISLEVKDNGEGIPKEDLNKIFDPFYTTKDPGKGTGLGLSICQRIVQQFDGQIKARSEKNIGTELEIIFTTVQN